MAQKLQEQIFERSGVAVGRGRLAEPLRVLRPVSGGPEGTLHRYCSGVILKADAEITPGEGAVDIPPWDLIDLLLGRISLSRFAGHVVRDLWASEIGALIGAAGCLTVGKGAICSNVAKASTGRQTVGVSILIPFTPSLFATPHYAKSVTDAPWPIALLGAASTLQVQLSDPMPANWTISEDEVRIEAVACIYETKDVILARPIEWIRIETSDDPAELPGPWSKRPTVLALAGSRGADLTSHLNPALTAVLRVDDVNLNERVSELAREIVLGWQRDDSNRIYASDAAQFLVLYDRFQADKMIDYPAGSSWYVDGIGRVEKGKVRYLWEQYEAPTASLHQRQLEIMGVGGKLDASRLSINSNPRSGMTLTEAEQLAIPVRVDQSRFTA